MIYVACPSRLKSGGPELAHQLVYVLNKNDIASKVFYIDAKRDDGKLTPEDFKKYIANNEYCISLRKASPEDMLVAPETTTSLVRKYGEKIKIAVWWMSVDNYFKSLAEKQDLISDLKRAVKKALGRYFKNSSYDFRNDPAALHLCQSYYAIDSLKKKSIPKNKIEYLGDYINDDYLNVEFDSDKKEDIVLYNPKKGLEFTEKIIESCPNVKFVPIQNLTTHEVRELLLKAKLYIDFGNHPGKDRFPREAAMCGCCVITDKRGSAAFYEDVPIDDSYKFEDVDENLLEISKKIMDILANYDDVYHDFDDYRRKIRSEREEFEKDAVRIFSKNLL